MEDVTMGNLEVFRTLYHTLWKRLATSKVPELPACPKGGCTYMRLALDPERAWTSQLVHARFQVQRHQCLVHRRSSCQSPGTGLLRDRTGKCVKGKCSPGSRPQATTYRARCHTKPQLKVWMERGCADGCF